MPLAAPYYRSQRPRRPTQPHPKLYHWGKGYQEQGWAGEAPVGLQEDFRHEFILFPAVYLRQQQQQAQLITAFRLYEFRNKEFLPMESNPDDAIMVDLNGWHIHIHRLNPQGTPDTWR